MVIHFLVWRIFHLCFLHTEFNQQVIVTLLLELDVSLIIHTCLQVHHVFADDRLHLQRVEVLLVIEHITHCLLVIFHLAELDQKYVAQLIEVFLHVVDCDALADLILQSFHSTIDLRIDHSHLGVIVLKCLAVLFHPEGAVVNLLLHSLL